MTHCGPIIKPFNLTEIVIENGICKLLDEIISENDSVLSNEGYFHRAIMTNDLETVKSLVTNGFDVHRYDNIALIDAAKYGHIDVVKYLVKECDAYDIHYKALIEASKNGYIDVVKYLIEECNIHSEVNGALIGASENGYIDIVKYLVEERDADIYAEIDQALINATRNGYIDVVKYLVETCNNNGEVDRALIGASKYGYIDVVKYLVEEYNADVHANADKALNYASRNGHIDVVKYLVEKHGTDVHAIDSPTLIATVKYGRIDVVRYLIEKCNVDAASYCDDYIILFASRRYGIEMMKLLVSNGAKMSDEMILSAEADEDKEIFEYMVSVGYFHKDINPYEYLNQLDERHLSFIDPKYEQIIKIIKSRFHKIVDAYTDIRIATI